ncbi:MAG TPA: hypothetical protein VF148_08235 [Acidimicrobiia bacterium]
MKFSGELKFPEIDHPGVPVRLAIDDTQLEMLIDGESLGRWSLYDVHARRLVASAFQIDLDGTEVTFVADDPIDFAYRGVEHMAETWATLKSKRMASRTIAVRKSRRDTIPSRIDDMKEAMVANLDTGSGPRQIAGEHAMPEPSLAERAEAAGDLSEDVTAVDWDRREPGAAIPLAGVESLDETDVAETSELSEQARILEQETLRLAEERARFEEERRRAELQEANRIEAYRLEMQRLEAEREQLRRQAAELEERAEDVVESEPEAALEEPVVEREPELESEMVPEEKPEVEPEPEPETPELETPELETPEPVPVLEEPVVEPELEAPEPELERAAAGLLDLMELEEKDAASSHDQTAIPSGRPESVPQKQPEPALAGASKDRGGLMGAVKAAFRSGPKHHEHQFIEAPGGMGITRYVCEECGYVSISV